MKKLAQPTRSFFTLKISRKTSSGWLQLVFHFGTENWADQLKKTPCIFVCWASLLDPTLAKIESLLPKNGIFRRISCSLNALAHFPLMPASMKMLISLLLHYEHQNWVSNHRPFIASWEIFLLTSLPLSRPLLFENPPTILNIFWNTF